MSEGAAKKGWLTPIKVGLVLTGFVLIGFGVMSVQRHWILLDAPVLECRENWERFWTSKPNEIGDTLAGFAGTLAFIWIVVTVWLQSNELGEQRIVLSEQREEFKHMVKAQKAQVEALQVQAALFMDEKKRRDEFEAQLVFEAQLKSIQSDLSALSGALFFWIKKFGGDTASTALIEKYEILPHVPGNPTTDEFFRYFSTEIDTNVSRLFNLKNERTSILIDGASLETIRNVSTLIEATLETRQSLSSSQQMRFDSLRLPSLASGFLRLTASTDIWKGQESDGQFWEIEE